MLKLCLNKEWGLIYQNLSWGPEMVRVFGLEPFSTNIAGLDNTINKDKGLVIAGDSEKDFYINISVNKLS